MHRNKLLEKLTKYSPVDEVEKTYRASFLSFVESNINCFERSLAIGHVTGSAWIVNNEKNKALLTHHRKLNRWLQPGGHADGECDIVKVATKEAREETGLTSLQLISEHIFDVDIHSIPARKNDPEHFHYDVRFLFKADETEPLQPTGESKALAWIPLHDLESITEGNESILRMAGKVNG